MTQTRFIWLALLVLGGWIATHATDTVLVAQLRIKVFGGNPVHTHKAAEQGNCPVESGQFRVAGTIRNNGQGWRVIQDTGHVAMGVAAVTTNSDHITIVFRCAASQVVTFLAVPDESLAARGFFIGSSVDRGSAKIILAKNTLGITMKRSPLAVSTARIAWSNIWFFGIFEK